MVQQAESKESSGSVNEARVDRVDAYEQWIKSTGVPIHRGYYVEDCRTVEVGRWDERECNAAFLVLAGQEGVSEARVTEIPPGKTIAPVHMALDEIVYVVEGRGLTTVWAAEGQPKRTFEWQRQSMFLIPRNHYYQMTNTQGQRPTRLLHYSYLPLAMSILPDPKFFFEHPHTDTSLLGGEFYSQAKAIPSKDRFGAPSNMWYGNFFPDMGAWDQLDDYQGRGAGGHRVAVAFPNSPHTGHMSVFPSRTYKKGHRHGPGVVIVIPRGEGYSIMWPEGHDKIYIPWHEASVFVPPNRWFHQHFNVGAEPARYLAFHGPRATSGYSERVEDVARDQIEYPDEDPWVRQKFEEELGKRGISSLMVEGAYRDRDYKWEYAEGD